MENVRVMPGTEGFRHMYSDNALGLSGTKSGSSSLLPGDNGLDDAGLQSFDVCGVSKREHASPVRSVPAVCVVMCC